MSGAHDEALDSATSWLVVVLGTLSLGVVWGTVYTFTVYAGALESAFGLSGLQTSSVFSVMTAGFSLTGGLAGLFVSRLPLRPVVATAGALFGSAVLFLQVAGSYPGLLLVFLVLGGTGGTLFVIVLSLVPQWFDRYEGRAMGIALAGNGVGLLVFPSVWLWLLGRTDVQTAFLVVGGVVTVLIGLASLVYRRPPGVDPSDGATMDATWLSGMLGDRRFLGSLLGFQLLWTWYFVLSVDFVDILTAGGIGPALAASAFGIVGGISVVSRIVSGEFADRVGKRRTLAAGASLPGFGLFLLLGVDPGLFLYGPLVTFGAGLGAVSALWSPVVVERFGPENATAIVGLFTVGQVVTAFVVPTALSVLVSVTGGYATPLILHGCASVLGVGLFYWGTAPRGG